MPSKPFTPEELEIAAKVMAESKIVRRWLKGELEAFGVDPKSPEGKQFIKNKKIEQGHKLIE
jgi:hypothetical protein